MAAADAMASIDAPAMGEALARLDALEKQAAQATRLEQRVKVLLAENEQLRAALARAGDTHAPTPGFADDLRVGAPVTAENVYVDAKIIEYVEQLVAMTRELAAHEASPYTLHEATPTAPEILRAAQELAHKEPRAYVRPDDVKNVAPAILGQRMILTAEAVKSGVSLDEVIDELTKSVQEP